MFQNLTRRQHTIVAEVVQNILPHILDVKSKPNLASPQQNVYVTQICATPEMTHIASNQHG